MELIRLTPQNIEQEHICCAISNTADTQKVANSKKAWLSSQFEAGYQFWKLDVRGKAFIEFVPAQNAWAPIQANGWMFIDCFWISGQFKGKGYANLLLQKAINCAKEQGLQGLVALSADKKKPFLSDPGFYQHKGFAVADTAPPYYTLLALPFAPGAKLPAFAPGVKQPKVEGKGFVVYYTNHCPHTSKYVPLLQNVAQSRGVPFTAVQLQTVQQAQAVPNPFTSYAMFYNGGFVSNEIFSEDKMNKFIDGQTV